MPAPTRTPTKTDPVTKPDTDPDVRYDPWPSHCPQQITRTVRRIRPD